MAIVWLASYPKSGNTWVRAFLANLLADRDAPLPLSEISRYVFSEHSTRHYERVSGRPIERLSAAEVAALRPAVQRSLSPAPKQNVFVKTHAAVTTFRGLPTIAADVTRSAVYIVRNPLDVAVSYAHHFAVSTDLAIEAMGASSTVLAPSKDFVAQALGSWSDHVTSWVDRPKMGTQGVLTMRYEDMMADPHASFLGMVRRLRIPVDEARVRKAVEFSSFKVLEALEAETGFIERPAKADKFFRKGLAGGWRSELTDAQAARIVRDHRNAMRRFGYLDDRGEPVGG
jgi:hypothetical protein